MSKAPRSAWRVSVEVVGTVVASAVSVAVVGVPLAIATTLLAGSEVYGIAVLFVAACSAAAAGLAGAALTALRPERVSPSAWLQAGVMSLLVWLGIGFGPASVRHLAAPAGMLVAALLAPASATLAYTLIATKPWVFKFSPGIIPLVLAADLALAMALRW